MLLRKPYFIDFETDRFERGLFYSLIGISILFLFEINSVHVLSRSLYCSLLCFVAAIPLLTLGIVTYELGFSISKKVAIPALIAATSTLGFIFAFLGITLFIFNLSIIAGLIFIFLILLTLLFLIFVYPSFILLNLKEISEIKDRQRLESFKLGGLYLYDKILRVADEWITWNEEGYISNWELFKIFMYLGYRSEDLMKNICVLRERGLISDLEFDEHKDFIFANYKNEQEIEKLNAVINEKMKSFDSTNKESTHLQI